MRDVLAAGLQNEFEHVDLASHCSNTRVVEHKDVLGPKLKYNDCCQNKRVVKDDPGYFVLPLVLFVN